jgi:hypothetical protein
MKRYVLRMGAVAPVVLTPSSILQGDPARPRPAPALRQIFIGGARRDAVGRRSGLTAGHFR